MTERRAAVLTVSDRCAAGLARDTAGPAVSALLGERLGLTVVWAGVVPDEVDAVAGTLRRLVAEGHALVVTAGGTGCAPRDITPEATRVVLEREVPGLAEAMRAASARITPHAWLQRGVCGIAGSTLIVNLPGSHKAAVENLEAILEVLPHALCMLAGDTEHPQSDGGRGTGDAG